MNAIVSRLKEPSTWAGLGAIAVAFGIDSTVVSAWVQALAALVGAVAVVLPERKA